VGVSDSDAVEAFDALVDGLKREGLGWLADQITDEVALGETKSESIALATHSELLPRMDGKVSQPSRSKRGEFLTRVEYSPQEKFDIAVGAVRAVVLGAVNIEDALTDALRNPAAEIHFVPGETGDIRHSVSSDDHSDRRQAVRELESCLNELTQSVKS
jgi:hypothetical protein